MWRGSLRRDAAVRSTGRDGNSRSRIRVDFVVTADFDDADGYLAYRDHPDHKKLVAELLGPFVTKRAAVQFEWSAALPQDLPG